MRLVLWAGVKTFLIVLALQGVGLAAEEGGAGGITTLRDQHIETVLAAARRPKAAIVVPADGRYREAVAIIQQAIRQAGGVELPVISDTASGGAPEAILKDRSVIALGNMATSKLIYNLYRQWYTLVDLRYPGQNGYAVRSVHNPYGTGNNVLLIGGSDDAGVLAGARRFAELIKPARQGTLTVGWCMETKLGEDVPPPPEPDAVVYAWDDSYREDDQGNKMAGRQPTRFSGWNPFSVQAALYYMTGDEKYLREFLKLAMPDADNLPPAIRTLYIEHVEEGQKADLTHPIALAHHYTTHRFAMIWNLIEASPLLTDEQRLRITNDMRQHHGKMIGGAGLSRHGAYMALTAYTEARYFNKYYPADRWKKSLEKVHENFMWWTRHPTWGERDQMEWINTGMHPVVHYFMLTDPKPWIDSGMAKVMLDTLVTIWSGQPYEPTIDSQSQNLMHQAAWMLRDGRYTYMARAAKYNASFFRIGQSWWPTPELEAVPPTDVVGRLCVVPLAEPDARDQGVTFDHRLGYQYVTYRSGLEPTDSFMRLDGFNGGRRNPHHVAALIYLRHGHDELLLGYGNQVSILRDGLSDNRVAMAAQLDASLVGEGSMYVSSVVPDAGFGSHQREVIWLNDRLTVVLDSITAREPGEFEIKCQWEPVKALHASAMEPRWAQSAGDPAITLVAAQPVETANGPGPLQATSAEERRDLQDDYVFKQTLRTSLKKGQRNTLINAIYADTPGQFSYRLDPLSAEVTLLSGKTRGVIVRGPSQLQEFAIDAGTSYLSGERMIVRAGKHTTVAGSPLFRADKAVDFVWDLANATLTVQSSIPVMLSLAVTPDATVKIDGKPAPLQRQGQMTGIRLSSGTHQLSGVTPAFVQSLTTALANLTPEPITIDRELARRTELPSPDWSAAWQTNLGGAVRVMKLTPRGDELWVSSEQPQQLQRESTGRRPVQIPGALHRLGLDGKQRWALPVAAPAETFAFSGGASAEGLFVVAGGMDNQLRAFSAQGELLWTVESQVWPNYQTGDRWDARWYTNPRDITGIRSLLIDDFTGQGVPQILVGRPSTVEAWTPEGKLIQRSPVRWGEGGQLAMVRRSDGNKLLVGNFYTGVDVVYVVGQDFKVLRAANDAGGYLLPVIPEATEMSTSQQRGVAELRVIDLDGNGAQEVVVARSGHWNDVRAYNADGTQCLWMHSFGPAEPRLIQELKGRFIRGLSVGFSQGEKAQSVAVGLSNGWAHCFAGDGRHLWSHHFPEMVTAVAHVGGMVAVGLADGSIALLDTRGDIVRSAKLDGEIRALAGAEALLLAGTSDGNLAGLAP